ncbi:MAG TPA: hypothetical protein PLR99_23415, partial [Polyangiaceae bacterium]|nr:hypothetical protein [Polyangiaceae bacterium]
RRCALRRQGISYPVRQHLGETAQEERAIVGREVLGVETKQPLRADVGGRDISGHVYSLLVEDEAEIPWR